MMLKRVRVKVSKRFLHDVYSLHGSERLEFSVRLVTGALFGSFSCLGPYWT